MDVVDVSLLLLSLINNSIQLSRDVMIKMIVETKTGVCILCV